MRVPTALAIVLSITLSQLAVAQGPGREVLGRVIDRDGKPVAGCAVTFVESGDHPVTNELLQAPTTTTDAEGGYRLTVPGGGWWAIVVAAKDHQVCAHHLSTMTGGTAALEAPAALLLPGTTLHGRVRDEAGKPVAGARVLAEDPIARRRAQSWRLESMAISDERGYFHVRGVPRTGMLATVDAPGFAVSSQFVGHGAPFDVTLTPTGMVRGRVVDGDGTPVANARLFTNAQSTRIHRSASDGHFELTAPNSFRFEVNATGEAPTYRRFTSEQLSGPTDDVVVRPGQTSEPARRITVRCVDDATGDPLESFRLSHDIADQSTPPMRLLAHGEQLHEYQREATLDIVRDLGNRTLGALVVDAPGHGFVIVALPESPEADLVVRLPPQCVLTGTVTDAATGKPAAGYRVRALPYANTCSTGTATDVSTVVTDADGHYRIDRLAAGEYGVQAYGAMQQSSPCQRITLDPARQASLDVSVPAPRDITIELVGEIPANSLATISWLSSMSWIGEQPMTFAGVLTAPPLLRLSGPRTIHLDPLGDGTFKAMLHVPSRDRVGNGLAIELGELTAPKTTFAVPDLRSVICPGRVELPPGTPTARIVVVARRVVPSRVRRFQSGFEDPFVVGIDDTGGFAIDLPPGNYALQLADLQSGIVFYTRPEPLKLAPEGPPDLVLRPTLHWLALSFATAADRPAVCSGLQFLIPRADDCLSSSLWMTGFDNDLMEIHCSVEPGCREMRLLVPAGNLEVHAYSPFTERMPATRPAAADSATVDVTKPEHHVTLHLPPPPDK